jgi:hypothetical protein
MSNNDAYVTLAENTATNKAIAVSGTTFWPENSRKYGIQYGCCRIGCRIRGLFRQIIRHSIRLLPYRLPYLEAFSAENMAFNTAAAVSVAVFTGLFHTLTPRGNKNKILQPLQHF